MKITIKKHVMSFLILSALYVSAVYAQNLSANWNLGSVSLGYERSPAGRKGALTANIRALSIMFQEINTGIGLSFCPVEYAFKDYRNADNALTFINVDLFWDFIRPRKFILGPFASARSIAYQNPPFAEFSAGLLFIFTTAASPRQRSSFPLESDIIKIRTGWRYYNNEHCYFFEAGIDISLLFQILVSISSAEDSYESGSMD